MNQINYSEKYIKYKTKYNELKNLIGGTQKNIFIVATHSYRLQCILNGMRKISNQFQQNPIQYSHIKRFKNCAIVRIYRNTNGNTCVQIIFEGVYDGIMDPKDTTHFEKADIESFLLEINSNTHPTYLIPVDVEIYLVRHGEGMHNVAPKTQKDSKELLDALLTPNGHIQAYTAGIELNKYLNLRDDLKLAKYTFCASDLRRTHETISKIKHVLNNDKLKRKGLPVSQIYILSCIHEITPNLREDNATEHDCDNPTKLAQTSIYNTSIQHNPKTQNSIKINWSNYISRDNCHNNINIIQQILALPKT
jgi:hypothetical protein